MEFKYRYVGFGTKFIPRSAARAADSDDGPDLYDNELAVDVGGACWGHEGERTHVIDHHFFREGGNYSSASAGVLHNARRIYEYFHGLRSHTVWLVTHRLPDFDAYCSMYLARSILSRAIPHDGWDEAPFLMGSEEPLEWLRSQPAVAPPERRWPILLAVYAATVDGCRRLACPKQRSLHSILYAAEYRGRNYAPTGAVEFFDEVRDILKDPRLALNPLYDSVLENSERFAPELALLDRQVEAYERDVWRARRAVVNVLRAPDSFQEWFPELQRSPLLADPATGAAGPPSPPDETAFAGGLRPNEQHLHPAGHRHEQVDGIYLRDPECVLFKEWARLDADNSSMGAGFLFTAVARSGDRSGPAPNRTDYYFALDPERAAGRHLYNIWSRLQAAEVQALRAAGTSVTGASDCRNSGSAPNGCRRGFEGRAGAFQLLFADPWFDGMNYDCTIVVTPNRGTAIVPEGLADDLSDDPVARIVQHELELSYFAGVTLTDLAATQASRDTDARPMSVEEATRQSAPAAGYYRFGRVDLLDDVELSRGALAEQIGRVLWRVLDGPGTGVPSDFIQRHLVVDRDSVGVWSRRGVVFACRASKSQRAVDLAHQFQELAGEARTFHRLAAAEPGGDESKTLMAEGEQLMRQMVRSSANAALPERLLLRRFLEASRLDRMLDVLGDLNAASWNRHQAEALQRNLNTVTRVQEVIHLIEYLIGAYYPAALLHYIFPDYADHHPGAVALASGGGIALVVVFNQIVKARSRHEG